ncbi:MAG: hypothetical protein ACR2O8_09070 [Rhizobiaceae bacterium]
MGQLQSMFRILLALRGLLQAVKQWSLRRQMRSEINLENQSRSARRLERVREALARHDRRSADPDFLRRKDRFRRN